jgi:hypothetical protein
MENRIQNHMLMKFRNIKSTRFSRFMPLLMVLIILGCNSSDRYNTRVSVDGTRWLINGNVINEGSPAEGLLMNVRMVNTIYEDESGKILEFDPGFDPDENTNRFVEKIPEYVAHGVNAFTICLQGGMPGYEGAINSAFNADGSLSKPYMDRAARVIKASDENGTVIILSLFYQRQHSHERALTGKEAIKQAVTNVMNWVADQRFTNVIIEISNEYAHGGFRNWNDGEWLMSDAGQVELIRLAKDVNPNLLVTTSGMGRGTIPASIAEVSDYLLIHFNNLPLVNIPERVKDARAFNKPIVCNEDDKIGATGAQAALLSVRGGAAWGLMHSSKNQRAPFEFDGAADDPVVYRMMARLVQPGRIEDIAAPEELSVLIGIPKDGDIFPAGKPIDIQAFPSGIEGFSGAEVHFIVERKPIGKAISAPWKITWDDVPVGQYRVVAVVRDAEGQEIMRSREVDFEVRRGKGS